MYRHMYIYCVPRKVRQLSTPCGVDDWRGRRFHSGDKPNSRCFHSDPDFYLILSFKQNVLHLRVALEIAFQKKYSTTTISTNCAVYFEIKMSNLTWTCLICYTCVIMYANDWILPISQKIGRVVEISQVLR